MICVEIWIKLNKFGLFCDFFCHSYMDVVPASYTATDVTSPVLFAMIFGPLDEIKIKCFEFYEFVSI